MDFKDLNYMVAIAKYQNITKAADSLCLTQPTLTKFLQNIEKELGQKLFSRIGNKFVLTYAGDCYLRKANEMLALKKELDQELSDIINLNRGILKIGFPAMRGAHMLASTLPAFKQLYPNILLDVVETDSLELESLLLKGELDLAFFNLPIRHDGIEYQLLNNDEILLILGNNHPSIGRAVQRSDCKYPWMDFKYFNEIDFILPAPVQRTRQIIDRLFDSHKIEPKIVLTTQNLHAAIELAAINYGGYFASETHLKHTGMQGKVQCFSIGDPKTIVNFVVAYRRGAYISKYGQDYIDIVRKST